MEFLPTCRASFVVRRSWLARANYVLLSRDIASTGTQVWPFSTHVNFNPLHVIRVLLGLPFGHVSVEFLVILVPRDGVELVRFQVVSETRQRRGVNDAPFDPFVYSNLSLSLSRLISIRVQEGRTDETGSRHRARTANRFSISRRLDRFDGWKRASNGNCYPFPDNEYLKYRARLMYSLLLHIGDFFPFPPAPPFIRYSVESSHLLVIHGTRFVSFRFQAL